MTNQVSDERLRNTRAWAAARVGELSGAEVIVAACDEALASRELMVTIAEKIEAPPPKRPLKRMTFEEMRRQTADDLRRVADLFEMRARAVEAGDMEAFYKLITDELSQWHGLLVLRQADRAERRELEETGT